MKTTKRKIRFVFTADCSRVGLETGDRRYAWPVTRMPTIIAALRLCAHGQQPPEKACGMVFADGGLVCLVDEPPKMALQGDRAVLDIPPHYAMTRLAALRLADGFEETLETIAGRKKMLAVMSVRGDGFIMKQS